MREHVTTNEKTSATIYIVEDHDIVRNLLVQLVERTPGVSLVGVAASAEEALEGEIYLSPQLRDLLNPDDID